MKVLIVDDEPLARERLAVLLGELQGIELVGGAGNGREALARIAEQRPDLVLLDIQMPGMDGLETARRLAGLDTPPAIIFCTAHDQHALAAFDVRALDYLVKPVREERLAAAIEKARRWLGAGAGAGAAAPARAPRSHICARVRGNLVLVPVEEILYLLADDKYVRVRHGAGEVLVEDSLKALEDEFGERFVRIHRNCLVAATRIAALERNVDGHVHLRLSGVAEALEVSRRSLPAVRAHMRGG